MVGVDIVDADGDLPDQDLPGARRRVRKLDEVQDIRTAGGGEADGVHGSGLSEMARERAPARLSVILRKTSLIP